MIWARCEKRRFQWVWLILISALKPMCCLYDYRIRSYKCYATKHAWFWIYGKDKVLEYIILPFCSAASLSPLWECGNLLPLWNILECGTPRAALLYFGLRHVSCRFRLRHIPHRPPLNHSSHTTYVPTTRPEFHPVHNICTIGPFHPFHKGSIWVIIYVA